MKKLLAIAVALMMLMASVAFAEPANVVVFDNINLLVSTEEQNTTVDLSGLSATVAMGLSNEVPTIQMNVANESEALLDAVVQFIEGRMLFALEGMSRPIAADMGPTGAQAQETLNSMYANLDAISDFKLPAFTGVAIPKVPVAGLADLLPMLGVEPQADGQATTFDIPSELVDGLLQLLVSSIPQEFASQLGGLDQVLANTSFAIKGRIADDGTTAELLLDVYPAQDGVTADSALGALYFASSENNDSLEVMLYQDGQSVTLGKIDLTSDPEAATLDFGIDLMGQVTLNVSLYPQDGAQVAAMALNVPGDTINASLTYGDEGEITYTDFAFEEMASAISASLHSEETPDGEGGKVGTVALNIAAYDQTINLTADMAETKADIEFSSIENPDEAYNANNLSEEDQQAMNEELNNALSGLMNYLNGVTTQVAA